MSRKMEDKEWPTSEEILTAISQGVESAIWRIANNATDSPCGDFYHHIKLGVKEGFEKVGCSCPENPDK
jgi:hypothetical protein